MSRVKLWSTLLASSIVSLVSLMSALEDRKQDNWERFEKWTVSVASISIAFSFFGCLASMLPEQQSHTAEAPLIIVVLGMWSAGMPAILDPDNYLAVNPAYGIANANLYFFSWAALICSIMLLGSWGQEANGDKASKTALQWVLLAASSYVVMGTTSAIFKETGCKKYDLDTSRCKRTKFAVYLGLSSGFMAMTMFGLKQAPLHCQGIVSFLLMVSWCCGVSYITFGTGPGITMGNVYFATWISLFLCLNITTTAVRQTIYPDNKAVSEEPEEVDSVSEKPSEKQEEPEEKAKEKDLEDPAKEEAKEKAES